GQTSCGVGGFRVHVVSAGGGIPLGVVDGHHLVFSVRAGPETCKLFPYTTLFRSVVLLDGRRDGVVHADLVGGREGRQRDAAVHEHLGRRAGAPRTGTDGQGGGVGVAGDADAADAERGRGVDDEVGGHRRSEARRG